MGVDREYIVWRWRCVDIKRSVDIYCVDNELGLDSKEVCRYYRYVRRYVVCRYYLEGQTRGVVTVKQVPHLPSMERIMERR